MKTMMEKFKLQEYSLLSLIGACCIFTVLLGYDFYDRHYRVAPPMAIVKDTMSDMDPPYDVQMEWIYEEEGFRGVEKYEEAKQRRKRYKERAEKKKTDRDAVQVAHTLP